MAERRLSRRAPDLPDAAERINRVWRSLAGHPLFASTQEGVWHPVIDIYDTQDAIVVQVELPGMKGQKMDVSLEKDHLVIAGRREPTQEYGEQDAYYSERPVGEFHRVIHLAFSVDEQGVLARYDDGILTVTLPKASREAARKIEIT